MMLTVEAYRDDVRIRDEAQARLVYSTLESSRAIVRGGVFPPIHDDGNGASRAYIDANASPHPDDARTTVATQDTDLVLGRVAKGSCRGDSLVVCFVIP